MKRLRNFKLKVTHLLLIVILVSFAAAYFFPGVESNEVIQTSITFIGILFGIIVGFFIADLYSRYQGIRENSSTDSSSLSTFYFLSTVIASDGKHREWLKNVKIRINSYIRKFMPLPWERYSETENEFEQLGRSLRELRYTTNKENETYANLVNVYANHSTAREKLVMYGKDKLSWGEWLVTMFLGFLLLASLFYIKDTSIVSIVFTGAIASAILILFIVMRDLNNLNFGENAVSIEPYERVLDAIGKPRYYKTKRRKFI